MKKVLIIGITGKQGGAVARHLISDDFEIFGLVRDLKKAKAKEVNDLGVQLLKGDLNEVSSYSSYLKSMDIVFFVQSMEQGAENEIVKGKEFMDAVREQGVGHLVYSSVLGADLNTGVPHFESKNILENHLKKGKFNYTILRPASFNENLLNPEITKRLQKGKLVMPLKKNMIQQFISTEDIGRIASQVINNTNSYKDKTIPIATDERSMNEVTMIFSKALNRKITYQKLPRFITRLLMGKDLTKMFNYMNKNNFNIIEDIGAVKNEFQGLGNLEDWINANFSDA